VQIGFGEHHAKNLIPVSIDCHEKSHRKALPEFLPPEFSRQNYGNSVSLPIAATQEGSSSPLGSPACSFD
jgi:hypothetical protein